MPTTVKLSEYLEPVECSMEIVIDLDESPDGAIFGITFGETEEVWVTTQALNQITKLSNKAKQIYKTRVIEKR